MENETAAEPQCTENTAQESGMLCQGDETHSTSAKADWELFMVAQLCPKYVRIAALQ